MASLFNMATKKEFHERKMNILPDIKKNRVYYVLNVIIPCMVRLLLMGKIGFVLRKIKDSSYYNKEI